MNIQHTGDSYLSGIPQPPGLPLLGNAFSIDRATIVQGFCKLVQEHGPVVKIDMAGRPILIVSDPDLVRELCDEDRFDKSLKGAAGFGRRFAGDGLFTAETNEPNWRKAHNILLPSFGQRAIQSYHPMMLDIAGQLMSRWERLNKEDSIDVVHDMTSLTLDTIGLCAFGYRFNSFYREQYHPFIDAMICALDATMKTRGLPKEDVLFWRRERRLRNNIRTMNELVDQIIRERRAGRDADLRPDLLDAMLESEDRETGERLDDANIRYQIITFLIAGHETTSGLLSFALHALMTHPNALAKCYEEVDATLGRNVTVLPSYSQIQRLTYVARVLKETLRLWPTAPGFALSPRADTTIGGRHFLKKGQHIFVLLPMLHRSRKVWGDRADLFDPGHFSREAEQSRPPHCYKPFGSGQRACIGQQFAMHEAALVLAMILQRFTPVAEPSYQLKIKETLTIKPDGLRIRVRARSGFVREPLRHAPQPKKEAGVPAGDAAPRHGTRLVVLYGSNMGTAEETARRIAADGQSQGFNATVAPMDDHAGQLPTDGLVVIVSASYNGKPPDNATEFCRWLNSGELAPDALNGVRYTVFGCGHHDWVSTFQAIPRQIDGWLEALGAQRVRLRGEGDAGDDFDGQFQSWYKSFWRDVAAEFGVELEEKASAAKGPFFAVEVLEPARGDSVAGMGRQPMRVTVNRELQQTGDLPAPERSTRHIEIELPLGVSYRAGDHYGVFPRNDSSLVQQIAKHFGFGEDSQIRLRLLNGRQSFLPVDTPIPIGHLLGAHVELQEPATRSQIAVLAEHTSCPHSRTRMLAWTGDEPVSKAAYQNDVLAPRKSVFDLLKASPACSLPFAAFLEMLPPLAPRYYSISSSPLLSPNRCSLTVGVLNGPARSGAGLYKGVCSNYLASQREAGWIEGFVKDTKSNFRLPEDPTVPLIMIGAGTGMAPFRGFLQERLALKLRGENVGPSLLFFGCRHPARDFLYEEELRQFEAHGIVEVHTAFSRVEDMPKTYCQQRIVDLQEEVWRLIQAGAKIYLCGDANRLAPGIRQALIAIFKLNTGARTEHGEVWLDELAAEQRYLVDVWPSN